MTVPSETASLPVEPVDGATIPLVGAGADAPGLFERLRLRSGLSHRAFVAALVVPVISTVLIVATLILAPTSERPTIFWGTTVAVAAGLSSTAIGVYGGVLVPGLLLLGVDARFAAAASLFLQVLVIPLGAGTHYKMGNVRRNVVLPLIVGGMIGSFIGPFFAAALPKDAIARVVAGMIVAVGILVLATMRMGGLGTVRESHDVPTARIGGIGGVAGFASGISGAGWGPLGVKLLILSRINPKEAIGSSLFARVFMAASAVVAYLISASAFTGVKPDLWLIIPLFAGSMAPMIPGAFVVTKLGRERATIGITLLSISLALPTLLFGH